MEHRSKTPSNSETDNTPIPGKRTGKAPLIRRIKLDHPELNNSQIARAVGCSPANVDVVLARFLGTYSNTDLREYQENKADVFDALQHRFHRSITDADISKAPLMARITAGAILEDKARTIRGQATQINVNVLLDAVNAARELRDKQQAEALESVRRRMAEEANRG